MLTVSVLAGLAAQATTVAGVHVAIRGEWLRRPGALLLVAAVIFHGLTEVMQAIWRDRNPFRVYVDQTAIDNWIMLVSVAIVIYGIAYGSVVVRRRRVPTPEPAPADPVLAGVSLPMLLALVAPLLVATWTGRGVLQPLAPGQADADIPERQGLLVDLAGEFLVPLLAITGAVVLVRHGTRWLIPVLGAQAAMLTVAGIRATIVIAGVLTLFAAALHGVRPGRRQVALIVVLLAAFTFLISSTRAVAGREAFDAGQDSGQRLVALLDGAGAIHTPQAREAILNDIVYRFDGNTFGALMLQGLGGHTAPVGLETMANNLAMLVPSLVLPGKVGGRTLEQRSEEAFLDRRFGLSQDVDWVTTIFGAGVTYFGPVGLMLLAALLGLAVAAAESAVLGTLTTTRAVVAVGLAQCALLYGSGPQTTIATLRLMAGLAALMWVVSRLRRGSASAPAAMSPLSADRRWLAAARTPGARISGTGPSRSWRRGTCPSRPGVRR
jgi:hypothetical protein